jgi:hypothetical protein
LNPGAQKLILENTVSPPILQTHGGKVALTLDATFPEKQFMINGFKKPYRNDRNDKGGGVLVYVRDDIPSLGDRQGRRCVDLRIRAAACRRHVLEIVGRATGHMYVGIKKTHRFHSVRSH